MSTPNGAIPFADLRKGDVVWTCEHPNGADHDALATFNEPPRQPRAMIVTEPQSAPTVFVFLAAIAPDTGKPIHGYDSAVTLGAPSRQFAFRDEIACANYYCDAMNTWARQIIRAVDDAMVQADAYLADHTAGEGE